MARDITAPVIADLPDKQITVSAEGEIVIVEIKCGDALLAEVLADDLNERLRAGEGFSMEVAPPRRSK